MSYLRLDTPEGFALVSGAERSYVGWRMKQFASAFLPCDMGELLQRARPGHWMCQTSPGTFYARMQLLLSDPESFVGKDGQHLDSLQLILNTVLAAGSDHMALLARIDGQNELHAHMLGTDRLWAADLLEEARLHNLVRAGDRGDGNSQWGWDAVVRLLREANDTPAVWSHSSGCGSFPCASHRDWSGQPEDDDEAEKAWAALDPWERWLHGLFWLSAEHERAGIRHAPQTLRRRFGCGLSIPDLYAGI